MQESLATAVFCVAVFYYLLWVIERLPLLLEKVVPSIEL